MENKNLGSFFTHLLRLHDPHAKAHSNHVAILSIALAREIGLPAAQVETPELAAKIHDIGKIAINDFIVNKPGHYTEAEYGMVKQHAAIGSELVKLWGWIQSSISPSCIIMKTLTGLDTRIK